jgi:hypothetical protein
VLRAGLVHMTGTQDGALMTETSGALVLTFAQEMLADPHGVPLPPLRISPSATPAAQRQWRVIRRSIVCFLRTLQLISRGSSGSFGVSAPCPADPARQFRAAAGLTVHAQARRDLFVSDPAQVGLHDGRRRALTRVLNTRLMTVEAFRSLLTRNGHRGKNHGEAGG